MIQKSYSENYIASLKKIIETELFTYTGDEVDSYRLLNEDVYIVIGRKSGNISWWVGYQISFPQALKEMSPKAQKEILYHLDLFR